MTRLIVCLILLLSSLNANSASIIVGGRVINQRTARPLSGVKVNLLTLSGTWKFWESPKTIWLFSQNTDEQGAFILTGEISRYYIVDIDMEKCATPFGKVFDLQHDGSNVNNLDIWISTSAFCNEQ